MHVIGAVKYDSSVILNLLLWAIYLCYYDPALGKELLRFTGFIYPY